VNLIFYRIPASKPYYMELQEYTAMARLESTLWWFRSLHDKVINAIGQLGERNVKGTLLDAGCGTGGLLAQLELAYPSWSFYGLDSSGYALDFAKKKSRSTISQGSVTNMPYSSTYFDVVVSLDVMYHRQVDPQHMLVECARILRPGGLLILNLPAYEWLRSYHDEHVQTARRYTLSSLATTLAGHPFRRLYATYWNAALFLPLVIKRKLLPTKHESSDVSEIAPWLNRLFYAVMSFENRLIRLRIRLPFGSSVFAIYRKIG
jgi:SAM-dependent methyltransferase